MLLPACTGTGLGVLVTDKSAESATWMLTVALLLPLFGSTVVEATESVWVIVVPCVTFEFTFTTKVKFAVVMAAIVVVSVQVGGTGARTHVHPAGPVRDTTVVFAGIGSVNTGAFAVAGPALVTLCVYVILLPAVTGFGLPELITLKSASVPDATAMFTVAELSAGFVSRVVVAPVSVSVMIVPTGAVTL